MKKSITIISLIIGFALSATAATTTVKTPDQMEFANKLVSVFGGKDHTLSQAELVRVLQFLQKNLPEQTQPTSIANRMSRENNFYNAPRGEMSEERISIREDAPERIAAQFIRKYDSDRDLMVNDNELAVALSNVIGTPKKSGRLGQGSVAKN